MKINKPWGYEIRWAVTDKYIGKILHINRSERLSLQKHEVKDEYIYVLKGILVLEVDGVHKVLRPSQSHRILPNVIHRFSATDEGFVELIEVSTPELDDIIRLKDDYGRA
tara:strand:- start:1218 stop:1547 length:330 start_codon:yes stop_codon:yes gene_type:complete